MSDGAFLGSDEDAWGMAASSTVLDNTLMFIDKWSMQITSVSSKGNQFDWRNFVACTA